ncbi:hypothetical protein BRAS3843_2770063 [Bradyrhizobium sp. STM 3843]|nr:hypothetical protein BRAS3843_2770063 [Bradyrhizobium sp. STM 3843]
MARAADRRRDQGTRRRRVAGERRLHRRTHFVRGLAMTRIAIRDHCVRLTYRGTTVLDAAALRRVCHLLTLFGHSPDAWGATA